MLDIETIAAAIYDSWRELARREGWSMQPHFDRPYAELDDDDKEDNRAAARRMDDVLKVSGLALSDDSARAEASLPTNIEPMAEAEHDGWLAQRAEAGWIFGETRDDAAKRHPSMLPYSRLPELEREKDRNNIRHYPAFAARAGYRIVRSG